MKGKGDDSLKHHVNAIMDDDFWQVVKEEKLQEGDFQVENSMSFGSSHWCRSTPSFEYRLTEIDEHRSTSVSPHRSTEEVATCATVRILTHEPFAAKHHHPPKTFRIKKSDIDRHQDPALSDNAPEPMQVDKTSKRRTLRKRKEKVPKHLKRGVNEKEMDSFTKRVLRIPLDKPFEEVYFTHRLWMFFRETKETEQDIHRIFDQIREKMKERITLKKKSDPGKFAVPILVKGIEFPCAMCDTSSSFSLLPKVMADHLGLKIEPSQDSFTFVDHSTRNSGGIIRDLEVQIGNTLVPVDFHVLENKQNKNHSLLLGRAFMATVGAVCNMQTNQLCLTLINPDVYNDPVRVSAGTQSGFRALRRRSTPQGDLGQTFDSTITLTHYEKSSKKGQAGENKPFKPFTHRYRTPYRASGSTEPFWYSIKRGPAYIIVLSTYSAYANTTSSGTSKETDTLSVEV
ncbi:hypothetical protein F2Q70_00030816 [Brassica cretica]|uniref:Aspartic peptidase DDI1-type domain-containing protein n=1 Tax=Brassica cretica TaxID=69181 RepID=A0A8S9FK33_BRACR|nr:hypothetical protein F2Q70_00030816 [Brassica cretica]